MDEADLVETFKAEVDQYEQSLAVKIAQERWNPPYPRPSEPDPWEHVEANYPDEW